MCGLCVLFLFQIKNIVRNRNMFQQLRLTLRRRRNQSMCLSCCHMRFFTRCMKLGHCRLEPQSVVWGKRENMFCIDFRKDISTVLKGSFPWNNPAVWSFYDRPPKFRKHLPFLEALLLIGRMAQPPMPDEPCPSPVRRGWLFLHNFQILERLFPLAIQHHFWARKGVVVRHHTTLPTHWRCRVLFQLWIHLLEYVIGLGRRPCFWHSVPTGCIAPSMHLNWRSEIPCAWHCRQSCWMVTASFGAWGFSGTRSHGWTTHRSSFGNEG